MHSVIRWTRNPDYQMDDIYFSKISLIICVEFEVCWFYDHYIRLKIRDFKEICLMKLVFGSEK